MQTNLEDALLAHGDGGRGWDGTNDVDGVLCVLAPSGYKVAKSTSYGKPHQDLQDG